jgi:hypothetical protein
MKIWELCLLSGILRYVLSFIFSLAICLSSLEINFDNSGSNYDASFCYNVVAFLFCFVLFLSAGYQTWDC